MQAKVLAVGYKFGYRDTNVINYTHPDTLIYINDLL